MPAIDYDNRSHCVFCCFVSMAKLVANYTKAKLSSRIIFHLYYGRTKNRNRAAWWNRKLNAIFGWLHSGFWSEGSESVLGRVAIKHQIRRHTHTSGIILLSLWNSKTENKYLFFVQIAVCCFVCHFATTTPKKLYVSCIGKQVFLTRFNIRQFSLWIHSQSAWFSAASILIVLKLLDHARCDTWWLLNESWMSFRQKICEFCGEQQRSSPIDLWPNTLIACSFSVSCSLVRFVALHQHNRYLCANKYHLSTQK